MNVWPGVATAVTRIRGPMWKTSPSCTRGPRGHVVGCIDQVLRAGAAGQGKAAGDVVVVDVGLEDVGQPQALLLEQRQDAVNVALGVHHEGDLAVMDEVAAVP